jgi:hypothetical protein
VNDNVQMLLLSVKELSDKLKRQEETTLAIQDNIEIFIQLYESRNGVVDYVITKHENDLKTSRDTLAIVRDQAMIVSEDVKVMQSKCMQRIALLTTKIDKYVEDTSECHGTHVSVDEHNQLRVHLEDQMRENDMKYDHLFLTVQQQLDEYQRRSEELEVVKNVAMRAKKRREAALSDIQTKYRILAETVEKDSNVIEVLDDLAIECSMPKKGNCLRDDAKKVHFNIETTESSFDDEINENNNFDSPQFSQVSVGMKNTHGHEDNDSEFGNSLLLLDELQIY